MAPGTRPRTGSWRPGAGVPAPASRPRCGSRRPCARGAAGGGRRPEEGSGSPTRPARGGAGGGGVRGRQRARGGGQWAGELPEARWGGVYRRGQHLRGGPWQAIATVAEATVWIVRPARYLLGVSRHRVALSVIPVGDEALGPALVLGVPDGRLRPARLSAKPIRRVPRHHGRVLASIPGRLLWRLPVTPLLPIRGDRPVRLA